MIEYDEKRSIVSLLMQRSGSVIPGALARALPSGIIVVLLMTVFGPDSQYWRREVMEEEGFRASQLWALLTGSIMLLISFRIHKAYARFWDGTTLLHQMWGEWFDAASCLFAFSSPARVEKAQEVQDFRHTLVRLMSLMHGSALEEIAIDQDPWEGYPVLDIGGLDQETLRYIHEAQFNKNFNFKRVEVIIHMLQTLVVAKANEGILKVPPPILSRVFQTLSRGQVNLANCKKITETLYPFPLVQLTAALLLVFSLVTPLLVAAICDRASHAFFITLVVVFGSWAVNQIAKELEMPFGSDDNDLPLLQFQEHMNNSMLMLIRPETDHVPFITPDCQKSFQEAKSCISRKRCFEYYKAPRKGRTLGSDELARAEGGGHDELGAMSGQDWEEEDDRGSASRGRRIMGSVLSRVSYFSTAPRQSGMPPATLGAGRFSGLGPPFPQKDATDATPVMVVVPEVPTAPPRPEAAIGVHPAVPGNLHDSMVDLCERLADLSSAAAEIARGINEQRQHLMVVAPEDDPAELTPVVSDKPSHELQFPGVSEDDDLPEVTRAQPPRPNQASAAAQEAGLALARPVHVPGWLDTS
eukprot:TRINITY_DN7313_c0_g1_i1.p1 TRINITY_DN7313_c0_g1~~TRINITY_DN7313_c0_g1_i1.p1  ORF type:complete len:584 (+),score=116.50 TRINITY_DN7313_c0_g1_i1:50-1801(+)